MCPHGYHHSGFMATPALGTQDVHLLYVMLCYVMSCYVIYKNIYIFIPSTIWGHMVNLSGTQVPETI